MSAQNSNGQNPASPPAGATLKLKTFLGFIVTIVLTAAILFIAAGRLDWVMGWLYLVVVVGISLAGRYLLVRISPGLVLERSRYNRHSDVKPWDKILVPLVAMIGPIAIMLAAGLDQRFGWSPALSLGAQMGGLALVVLGYALSTWAMLVNKFFSAVVRIQKERGHSVISAGPYRVVRHPGYAGGIVANLAGAIALGSLWALIPAGLVVLLTILRTALEDRTLQEELPGYREYAGRVRYRLWPGLW